MTATTQPASSAITAKSMDRHEKLLKQSNKLVAQTFYGTLLKQMDDSPFKDKMLSGGRGGQAFGAMLHQTMAEHMGRGPGKGLAQSIARKIEGSAAYKAHEAAKKAGFGGKDSGLRTL